MKVESFQLPFNNKCECKLKSKTAEARKETSEATWICIIYSRCHWIIFLYKNYITLTALSLISCWKASFSFLNEVRYFCKDSSDKHITIIHHCRQERSYRPVLPLNFHKEENTLSQAFQDWKLWRPVQKWWATVWVDHFMSNTLPQPVWQTRHQHRTW